MGREGPIKKINHLHKDCCLPKPRARRHLTYTVNQRHTASAGCKAVTAIWPHYVGCLGFLSLSNFVIRKMDQIKFYGTPCVWLNFWPCPLSPSMTTRKPRLTDGLVGCWSIRAGEKTGFHDFSKSRSTLVTF